jgi:hypothetical protein
MQSKDFKTQTFIATGKRSHEKLLCWGQMFILTTWTNVGPCTISCLPEGITAFKMSAKEDLRKSIVSVLKHMTRLVHVGLGVILMCLCVWDSQSRNKLSVFHLIKGVRRDWRLLNVDSVPGTLFPSLHVVLTTIPGGIRCYCHHFVSEEVRLQEVKPLVWGHTGCKGQTLKP